MESNTELQGQKALCSDGFGSTSSSSSSYGKGNRDGGTSMAAKVASPSLLISLCCINGYGPSSTPAAVEGLSWGVPSSPEPQLSPPDVQHSPPDVQHSPPDVQHSSPDVQLSPPDVQLSPPDVLLPKPESRASPDVTAYTPIPLCCPVPTRDQGGHWA
ncbi:hypothetical protein WISP_29744 [Willisornis vidua]|uniref:Uncharacterized protein n=1 Tax=Willisornis vidua TaxID=1566151 RepID=A0ABQ9DRC5_9PASS|nr:hypothetical protein WISP_29744 [Willisornis vidua]